jgi:hypothetical protein
MEDQIEPGIPLRLFDAPFFVRQIGEAIAIPPESRALYVGKPCHVCGAAYAADDQVTPLRLTSTPDGPLYSEWKGEQLTHCIGTLVHAHCAEALKTRRAA